MNPSDEKRPGRPRSRDVRRRFDRAAAGFHRVDFVHRRAAEGMLERLAPVLIEPAVVLDAGSATGAATDALARRFRGSRVVSLDLSLEMLRVAKSSRSRFTRTREVQADAERLPIRDDSVDLVFANMLLPWIDNARFFSEAARVLRQGGLFVFSSLGPDSLGALRDAWLAIDDGDHVNAFTDMHDVGDGLLRAGLREAVLDVDYLAVTYDDARSLFADLTAIGARNCLATRRKSLTGRGRFDGMRDALDARFPDGKLSFSLELVFGHAWGGSAPRRAGEFTIDAGTIGRRKRT